MTRAEKWWWAGAVVVTCSMTLSAYSFVANVVQRRVFGLLINGFSIGVSACSITVLIIARRWRLKENREHAERMAYIHEMIERAEQVTKGADDD
jgi:uncharacterized membrane protein (DUF4010 family)